MTTEEKKLAHRISQAKYLKTHPAPHIPYAKYKKEWKRTFKGYFSGIYHGMLKRCRGKAKQFYSGMPHMQKQEWLSFMEDTEIIRKRLFEVYKLSNWNRKFAPSIDRIDSSQGYIVGNCQWLTVSENASKRWEKGLYRRPDK